MSNRLIFGSGASSFKDFEGLYKVCSTCIDCGITSFDTAPSYKTEELLSKVLNTILSERKIPRSSLYIQTKIDPIQMYEGQVEKYFESKLSSMQIDYIDALLIHWPVRSYLVKTWESIHQLKLQGLAKRIGICNLRSLQMHDLESIGILPDVIQIERHPLNTFEEEIEFCRSRNIEIQDYSPLCKMNPFLSKSTLLLKLAEKYKRDIGSIIMRWHVETGATPVFTSKNVDRIKQYSTIDGFKLETADVEAINGLNGNFKLYLESLICPGF